MLESGMLSPTRRRKIINIISAAHGHGGTNMDPAMLKQLGILGMAKIG